MSKVIISEDELFLPNFCEGNMVFLAIILAEIFAVLLTLTPFGIGHYQWTYIEENFLKDLGYISIFIQWVVLLSVATLCFLRNWFKSLSSNALVGILSYIVILVVTGLTSEIAWRVEEILFNTELLYATQHHTYILKNLVTISLSLTLFLSLLHYKFSINKQMLVIIAVTVTLLVIVLSEIASFLLTPSEFRIKAAQHQLFLLRNLGMSALIGAVILRYLYVQYHWHQQTMANAYARIQALQARIRPHFLFNSMNSIASLVRIDPDKAEEAIEDFAELFRASLADVRQRVRFEDEIHVCEQYLRMEELRLEERLQVDWNIESIPSDALIPPLTLQPLLENAVYHGIQLIPEGGTIQIVGLFDGLHIQIDIESPVLPNPTKKHVGNQIGQQNILQRLRLYFGNAAKMRVEQHATTYCVSLKFPYQNHENTNR